MTKRLSDISRILETDLLDHFIIGKDSVYSFALENEDSIHSNLNEEYFHSISLKSKTERYGKRLFPNSHIREKSASIEVVGSSEFGEKPYEISEMVGNFSKETIVYGYDELNALDNYGEYLEEIGFDVENDIAYSEGELEEGNFYFANGYLPIDLNYIHMNEVEESYVDKVRKNSKQLQYDKEVNMEI